MTRTISLADDAYDALAAAKRPGESFSDVARRLARLAARERLFDRSVRLDLSDDEVRRIKEEVYRARDASSKPRYDVR